MRVTSDLSEFGWREKKMAAELLNASCQGLPEDFYDDAVTIAFNTHSGCVFLTNSNFDVAMMNGGRLETFYNCPNCGHEGFKEDMGHNPDDSDCLQYLKDIGFIAETNDQDEEEA